jgi:hypothetical protein
VRPKKPGFIPTNMFLCSGGGSGSTLATVSANSCGPTFTTAILKAGACVATYRDVFTDQIGTGTFQDGHETVAANGNHTFALGTARTLNVNDIVIRTHTKGSAVSHSIVSSASSSTDNFEITLGANRVRTGTRRAGGRTARSR